MNKTWQTIALLGVGCFLFILIQYLSTMRVLDIQKEFQPACVKIKKEFDLEKVNIIRFQKPEEYRIVITPKTLLSSEEALKKMEEIGLFFKKNCVPLSTIDIKVLHIKEVSNGCSYNVLRLEKTLDKKDTNKILLPTRAK